MFFESIKFNKLQFGPQKKENTKYNQSVNLFLEIPCSDHSLDLLSIDNNICHEAKCVSNDNKLNEKSNISSMIFDFADL